MVTLVTGASGFVGSHLLDELLARRISVRALVRDSGHAGELHHRGVEVLTGDVRDPQVLATAVRGVDVVYHCAAAVGPAFSPHEIYDVGLSGARNLLEGLRQAGVRRVSLASNVPRRNSATPLRFRIRKVTHRGQMA